jgi:hypothetical protein
MTPRPRRAALRRALPLALLCLSAQAAELPRLLVRDLQVRGGASADIASALTESLAQEAGRRGFFQVVSTRDVVALLGLERQKQLLGCGDEASSCLTELTGALDARFVVSGTLTLLGEGFQLSVQTLDARTAQPLGRSLRIARDLQGLRAQVPFIIAEATGTPLPPPPSRALPITLTAAGGVALAAAGVLAFNAFTVDVAVASELSRGEGLRSFAAYDAERARIGTLKSAALGLAIGGAALAAGGVTWLLLQGREGGAAVALVPTGNGLLLAGAFP